ncbi:hypothetical protein DOTSEDRAFT_69204 [Dothistroma septosporum NZE10]|uniref:Uncharacterized protein n=1 Tax=Dothistroma septosporum (strain NZE10 / CBS 128990) TaxID=675120 RepID=N1PUL8_DOTSN|nr:hypothetical protein DOTSEDRAFT_69204 [Dothistroma septosporum NZE10]
MAVRQHEAPVAKRSRSWKEQEVSDDDTSAREAIDLDDAEEEFHTEDESEAEDAAHLAGEDSEEEFHTASEDEEEPDDESETRVARSAPLLPAALLKSKSTTNPVPVKISWDQLSRADKKALRDEMGVSMKQLRTQVQGTGVLEAGRAAQVKRGILPADKVAGSRIARRKRKGREPKIEASGKQTLIEARKQRALLNARGSVQPVKKRRKG